MNRIFKVADENAIESRVGGWLAECKSLMDVFVPCYGPDGEWCPNGKDPYLSFAANMYGTSYDSLYLAYKSKDKVIKSAAKIKRQNGKVGVLAGIYRIGGGEWGPGKSSYVDHIEGCDKRKRKGCGCPKVYDKIRTGLWGSAWNQGVEIDQETAHFIVRAFRNIYPEICGTGYNETIKGIWVLMEEAVLDVMDPKHPNTVRFIGPNKIIKIDRLNITGRLPMMRMHLPSGRKLHYVDAEIRNTKMPWKDSEGRDVYRPALWYSNANQTSGNWESISTHGGKIFQNAVQGIARDVLGVKLLQLEENDMPVVLHVHDEGGSLVLDDPFSPTVERMIEIMSESIDWAPGLLLGADGWEGSFYHK